MKNIFRFLMAVAVLFTASCAKEDISSSIGGGEVEVTFTASLPELGTRTFGNGENADILFYNIYEAGTENKLSDLCGSVESNTGVFNIHIVLLKGMQYDLVFWAQNKDCGYYTLDGKQVTAVYEGKNANDDVRDAFYNFIPNFNPANPETTSFALHRPFAQLNAAVKNSDIDAVEASDVVLTTSTVEVDTYTGFNIATGDVTGNKSTVTFVATAVPSTEVFRTDYTLLSMNYLLVPKAGMVSNAAFSFNAKKPSGEAFTFTGTSYNDVPLKQNYRTNILGELLTKPTDIEVTIDAAFGGAEDIDGEKAVTTNVATIAELQDAIDAAAPGHNVIRFEQDINAASTRATLAEVTIAQKAGVNLTIDGCGYKFEGKITVNGDGRSKGAETLTFTNIKFYTEHTTNFTFIDAPSKIGTKYNYSHNVTIDGCSFEFVGDGTVTEIGSASFTGTYNLRMRNCTATNMHSLLQVQSCDNTAVVDNVQAINCKNGISFGNTAYPTLTNATITTRGYGVRGDGDASRGNLVIKNSTITSKLPLSIRRIYTDGYSVSLEGNTVLNTSELYHIEFTNHKDDATFVAPTKTWSISGAEGYNVFPVEEGAPIYASSEQQISTAINAGITEITLNEGEYVIPDSAKGKTVTFVGNGNVKVVAENDGAAEGNCDYSLRGSTATFKNITITTTGTYFPGYAGLKGTFENCTINGVYTTYDSSTFKNCTFNFSGDNYNLWTWGAAEVTLDGCTFNCDGKAVLLYGTANTKLTVNNCTFNDNGGLTDLKAAIEIGNDYDKSYELFVNNATVNGFEINDKGINTGTTLWANKNSMPQDKLNVVIDGVDVY
ncbi:MAG: hypothetical protein IJZ67_05385 [Alistipes sp.]|nr:hypothetical protein [Alistipes sp.]